MDNVSFGDIAITGFNSPPSTIVLGESYNVSITITNLGSETVIGDPFPVSPDNIPTIIRNGFYLSENDLVDSEDILLTQAIINAPLEPGESATGTTSIFIDPPTDNFLGNSFIIFQTSDAEFGGGNGGNESNNTVAFAVNIVDPDAPDPNSSLIRGTASADTLVGDPQNNEIEGLGGNDTIRGLAGNDTIDGNNGSDRLLGQNGDDELFGDNGNDLIFGGADNDTINGGSGSDTLFGNTGADNIFGGVGNDKLVGGDDSDVLSGEAGSDTLQGGNGNDTLSGGTSFDVLTGGNGFDVFVLKIGEDADLITDFNLEQDSIDVRGVSPEDVTAQGNIIKVGDEILATVTGVNLSNQSANIF